MILLLQFFCLVLSIIQTHLNKLEDLIKQVASKVPVQIPLTSVLHHSLCMPVNKKSDWWENKERGSARPIRKESLFRVENGALEDQLLPGDTLQAITDPNYSGEKIGDIVNGA